MSGIENVRKLENELKAFQKIEKDIQTLQSNRQKLLTQKNENTIVQEELGYIKDDGVLYKLVGPVLVKQEKSDVESTVKKRLEYIETEIKRLEDRHKELLKEREVQRKKVVELQALVASQKKVAPTK